MNSINRFSLEKHEGPYEKWPLRSRLFSNGERTGISLPGYSLLQQFETPYGFVLVSDFDCPFEKTTAFSFISPQMRLLSCRWLGWMYTSCRFTIRSWGIWYIRPRL